MDELQQAVIAIPFDEYVERVAQAFSVWYGITLDDVGLDYDQLAEAQDAGQFPLDLVEVIAAKYDLTRLPADHGYND